MNGAIRSLHLTAALVAISLVVCAPAARTARADAADASVAEAETLPVFIRANYVKFEHLVPMRDGVRLHTTVYSPLDRTKTYPILMVRTPYGSQPYGADKYPDRLGPHEELTRDRFIFVEQDVRGRYRSEGIFENMRPHRTEKHSPVEIDESSDTWDTIEWLLANVENNNGRVGMWGISYPGFYAAAGAIDAHPALRAVSPQAPIGDWFIGDDMHRNGAFNLNLTFAFFSRFGQPHENPTVESPDRFEWPTSDGYEFFLDLGPLRNANDVHFNGEVAFWKEIVAHPNYDSFWQARSIIPHLQNVGAAVMTVGGWYDTEDLYGPLAIYESIEARNPEAWNVLVMGPWSHGGWTRTAGDRLGEIEFGTSTSAFYKDQVSLPFFRHFLKDDGAIDLPEALVFETGANRWRRFDAWPPAGASSRTLYMRDSFSLASEPPPAANEGTADAWTSDPAKPVPYTPNVATGWSSSWMTDDQRFAARRPDVLVYQSEPLDADVTVAGPITADLWFSTSREDADVVVKLIDAHPGRNPGNPDDEAWPGHRQALVRGGVMRGRFRESFETPKPFVPGEPARVRFELLDVLHTFKRGHRIMVHVQSTWFPFIDRNPQTWVESIYDAEESDYAPATHRIHRSADRASRIDFAVIE